MVGVVSHERGHVEVRGQPRLPLRDEIFEPFVGVFAGTEASDLTHRPEPAAVHGRIGSAREWVLPRQTDVLERRGLQVESRIDALHGKAAKREALLLSLPLLLQESRYFIAFPQLELSLERGQALGFFRCVHRSPQMAALFNSVSAAANGSNSRREICSTSSANRVPRAAANRLRSKSSPVVSARYSAMWRNRSAPSECDCWTERCSSIAATSLSMPCPFSELVATTG